MRDITDLQKLYEKSKKDRDQLTFTINEKNIEIEKLQNKYFKLKRGIKECLNDQSGDYNFIKYKINKLLNELEG
jgi:hypothetical protein